MISIEQKNIDRELLSQLSKGSEKAFQEIYNHYWKLILGVAINRLSHITDAEDIVQEVFLSLWRQRQKLDVDSLPAYLGAMTRYMVYRKLAKGSPLFAEMDNNIKAPSNPEAEALARLQIEAIVKLANKLPEKCRLVFIRNKLMDQPLRDIAKEQNISLKTAEAHLTKALKEIRSQIKNRGNETFFQIIFL